MKDCNVFLALKKSKEFGFDDVQLLADHIVKYNPLVRVYCICEVKEETQLRNVTLLPAEHPEWPGWWIKMNFFSPELEKYRPFLYMDLDTAVLGDLSDFFPKGPNEDMIINLRDFYRPHPTLANGVAWLPANNSKVQKVWDAWISNPEENMRKYPRGDMWFIGGQIETDLFWQDITPGVVSFKPRTGLGRIEYREEIHPETAIVCFHGFPRIGEAAGMVKWVKRYVDYEC